MDLKNTAILFMLLLCILGLIIGACYTEASENAKPVEEYDEMIYIDSNGEIIIPASLQETDSNFINRLLASI